MPRKPSKTRMYFHEGTEQAIVDYNATDDWREKNAIYNANLRQPFEKLVENIIHTFKFYYFDIPLEDVKHEVISFMITRLGKYKQGKGKAFSYFGTIAKRYLILYNNNNYKKLKQKTSVEAVDTDQSIVIDLTNNYSPDEPMDRATEFIEYLLRYFDLYLFDHFPKPEDAKTADAILELFRKRENIELFNKKAIYIYIREMTDQSTPQITKVIKKMKKIYVRLMSQYNEHGYVSMKF